MSDEKIQKALSATKGMRPTYKRFLSTVASLSPAEGMRLVELRDKMVKAYQADRTLGMKEMQEVSGYIGALNVLINFAAKHQGAVIERLEGLTGLQAVDDGDA